ncbi:MAG: hypothetical protein IPM54_43495 [Polyangiaceae bacterium]|nr:hypothetical protein [Polyangiaceae bacterium]
MSDKVASTDPNALLFPAFLYGPHASCRRKMKAEAKKWAKRYEAHGEFPEPKLIPVPPGSVMICSGVEADFLALGMATNEPCWFFYLMHELRMEVRPSSGPQYEVFQPKFEAFLCRYPWGALYVATTPADSTIDLVSRRLEAVLSFWEQLGTLRYLRYCQYTLTTLMHYYYEGTIRMWVDAPAGSVKDVLRAAMERMRHASEDEIQARMMRRLHEVADTDPELKHREWLKSPGVIEAELTRIKEIWPELLESMKSDDMGACAGFLRALDGKYPGD